MQVLHGKNVAPALRRTFTAPGCLISSPVQLHSGIRGLAAVPAAGPASSAAGPSVPLSQGQNESKLGLASPIFFFQSWRNSQNHCNYYE